MDILQIALLILLTVVIVKTLNSIISKLTSPIRVIPSPPGYFFLGNFPDVIGADAVQLFEFWLKNFSRDGMTRIVFLAHEIIVTTNPEHVKKVLVSESTKFSRASFIARDCPAMKDGLFGAKGKEHSWQRKLLHSSFTSINVKPFADLFIQKSSLLVKLWKEKINKEKASSCMLVVEHDIEKLLFDVITMAAFGHDFNTLADANDENTKALETILKHSFSFKYVFFHRFFGFLSRFFTLFGMEDLHHANRTVDKLISEVILSKEKKLKATSENSNQPHAKPDLLEIMMKLRDEDTGGKMSEKVLKSNVITFIIAGYDTSCSCLTWTLYLLALHKEKQEKARQDVLNASPKNSDITVESIERMPYIEYVLKESLRLYPPGPIAPRETLEPVKLGGVCIPTGTPIYIPICVIHRSEEYWENPLEFKPERFDVEENINERKKDIGYRYLPFCKGPRGCIGSKFAMLEMKIIMAFLLKNFKFSISPNHPKVRTEFVLTLKAVPSPEIRVEVI